MTCIPPKVFHREVHAGKWDSSGLKLLLADVQEPVFGVQIGPESDFDRCWIFPAGEVDAPLAPTRDSQARTGPAFPRGIKVSVESPYIGFLPQGPYAILLPYARQTYQLTGTMERYSPVIPDTEWLDSMYGLRREEISEGQPGLDPLLQVVFHRMPVAWLPTKRPPMEWIFSVDAWSAIGAPVAHIARIPGFGRRSLSLSLEMTDYTAGSLTWSFTGVNAADAGAATDTQFHRETLGSGTGLTANFDETYFFDGEFDYYELELTEATALGAGTDLRAIIKAWD